MPLRMFGGISRSELTKSLFYPVTYAAGGAVIANLGFHTGVYINAAGQTCQIEVSVPSNFTVINHLALVAVDRVASAFLMNMRIDWDMAGIAAEAYNFHTGTFVVSDTVLLNVMRRLFTLILINTATPLAANDRLGIRVTYQAAGPGTEIATDAFIIGVLLGWN